MQNWKNTHFTSLGIGILLYDRFSNHCLANFLEPLRAANQAMGKSIYRWSVLTLNGEPARSSSGLTVTADAKLSAHKGDRLIVMPSYNFPAHDNPSGRSALRASARRYGTLAGLDTGSWLLAGAGLLDGYKATIHWDVLTEFAETFPDTHVVSDDVVFDRDRVSCGGAHSAYTLALEFIRLDCGEAIRLETASLFSGTGESLFQTRLARRKQTADALDLMRTHLEQPIPIAKIAAKTGQTQKTLSHHMKRELGALPQKVYQQVRLNEVRRLVRETNQSVAEIALRCGWQNAASMTRAFKAAFGKTPRQMRQG